MKVLVSCANGAGTSLMMKMKVQQALKDLNVNVEGKSTAKQYDVVFCSANFIDMFKDAAAAGVTVIGMKNILSVDEAKTRMKEAGLV